MNLDKLTEKTQEAIKSAQQLAAGHGHAEVTPEHVLVVLADRLINIPIVWGCK